MKKNQMTYAIWPWGTKTKEQAELSAKEITDIGYHSFESVKNAMYAYDLNSSEYKKMLQKYDLKAQSFYFSIPAPAEVEAFFANLEREFQFVAEMDVTRVTLQGTYDRPQIMGEKEKEFNLNNMIRFAKLAKSFGLTTNAHPHVYTYFMFEADIDYVMANSDKDLIYFAPDTAHIAAAGADPVEVIRRYADRVNFTHLKDYKLGDGISESGWVDSGVPVMSCFHGLGDGSVNFPEIFKILDSVNYTGPLCIELDKPPVSNADSAKKNYDYLSKFLED